MSQNPYDGMTSSVSGAMKGANLGAGKGGSELNRQSTRTDRGRDSHAASAAPTPQFRNYSKADMSRASMNPDEMDWQEWLGLALWGLVDEGNYEGFFRLCGIYEGAFDDAMAGLSRLAGIEEPEQDQPQNIENFPQPMSAVA